ncbi:MAG: hypothetical protein U0989_18735 [Azonexus sp.]|nr:hypothetical protein [Burkholderiaceae bacterium]MDP3438546.1 hypothetical protein [Azonexus sp.]MDP3635813.1 hypothetical protein [Azonexus sp.]MDZ4316792.1 hypothetical protein [Azonexus sp.]
MPSESEAVPEAEFALEMARQNKEKHERLQQQKNIAARADRAWEQAARVTREAMLGMGRAPKVAGTQPRDLSQQTTSQISQGQEFLLHLLGDKDGEGPQFRALMVATGRWGKPTPARPLALLRWPTVTTGFAHRSHRNALRSRLRRRFPACSSGNPQNSISAC